MSRYEEPKPEFKNPFPILADGLTSVVSGVAKVCTYLATGVVKVTEKVVTTIGEVTVEAVQNVVELMRPQLEVQHVVRLMRPQLEVQQIQQLYLPLQQIQLQPTDPWGIRGFGRLKFDISIKAWDMSKIKPELQFYRNIDGEVKKFTLDYEKTTGSWWKAYTYVPAEFFKVDKLIFVAHGFLSSNTSDWMGKMTDALLYKERNCTVVRVGWSRGAKIVLPEPESLLDIVWIGRTFLSYTQAAVNCIAVGKWLGNIISDIKNSHENMRIHCIGHSLGAHLMGFAGKVYSAIERITGLDPAGPGFQNAGNIERLNKNDAKFVDVIHTDGYGYMYYFGTLLPMGNIDFYPNYGYHQKQISGPEVRAKAGLKNCHSLAVDYFIHSITNNNAFKTNLELCERPDVEKIIFKLKEFPHWVYMGYNLERYRDKIYASDTKCFYLDTDPEYYS